MTPDQQEAREERQAIMQVEGESETAIQAVFRAYPNIYGYSEQFEIQERLI
jgi:hypothetical protein